VDVSPANRCTSRPKSGGIKIERAFCRRTAAVYSNAPGWKKL
jgi:hypothetical protein